MEKSEPLALLQGLKNVITSIKNNRTYLEFENSYHDSVISFLSTNIKQKAMLD